MFTADLLKFLESLTSKFLEKPSLNYAVVRNAKSLNQEIMCMTPEKGMKRSKSVVDNLVQLDRVTAREADGMYAEYKQYLQIVVMKNLTLED